jgi:hypothetical protein
MNYICPKSTECQMNCSHKYEHDFGHDCQMTGNKNPTVCPACVEVKEEIKLEEKSRLTKNQFRFKS